jgi:hypothetical protein
MSFQTVLPGAPAAAVSDIIGTTRSVSLWTIRMDTLNTQGIQIRPNQDNIGAIFNFLKTQTTITFPANGKIEGWWWLPGQDAICVQVNDSTLATVALNDIIPNNVL